MNELLHVYISGRVQGVGFRQATYQQATRLGLLGWVRNTSDGRVEATFSGPREIQERMLAWCYEGPPFATVVQVDAAYEPQDDRFVNFDIRF